MSRTIRLNLPPAPTLAGSVQTIPNGEAGARATLARMWGYMRPEKTFSEAVYSAARQLTQHVRQHDFAGEARALFRFVRDHIRYVRETPEVLQLPAVTLELRAGDCDDKVMLLGAMLISTGAEVELVAGGYVRGEYTHVWLRSLVGGRWIAMDPTEDRPMGWEPPMPERLVARDRWHR